jgi:hypothetical protein
LPYFHDHGGKSFDIPAILFYLASESTNKNKREDDNLKMLASVVSTIIIAANAVLVPQWVYYRKSRGIRDT